MLSMGFEVAVEFVGRHLAPSLKAKAIPTPYARSERYSKAAVAAFAPSPTAVDT